MYCFLVPSIIGILCKTHVTPLATPLLSGRLLKNLTTGCNGYLVGKKNRCGNSRDMLTGAPAQPVSSLRRRRRGGGGRGGGREEEEEKEVEESEKEEEVEEVEEGEERTEEVEEGVNAIGR